MRIGIDVDGVLADFNERFIERTIDVTGTDLFPPRPFDIPTWNYPEHYGYDHNQVSAVWESIKADREFWFGLSPYGWTREFLRRLREDDDVYFITNRPGLLTKTQTEDWLRLYEGPVLPTVLVSSMKGFCARALDLDAYIDDRDVNVVDVRIVSPKTRTFILGQPWNRTDILTAEKGIERVSRPLDFLTAIGR